MKLPLSADWRTEKQKINEKNGIEKKTTGTILP